ncbi:MAG: hypothetical protein VCA18_09325, partial [Opitutales bacterium]
ITSLHGPFRLEFVIERVSLARMRFFPFGLLVGTASLSLCYGQPYQATCFKVGEATGQDCHRLDAGDSPCRRS